MIIENYSLKEFNTFGINANSKYFLEANSIDDLRKGIAFFREKMVPLFILGGGSNILLTDDFEGLTVKISLKGIEIKEESDFYLVKAQAGENWHDLVIHLVNKNIGGLENLSLIPGTVGAAPIQNIGAYGVEIKEYIESVEALEIESGNIRTFPNEDCDFDYRYSTFKGPLKGDYIITCINLILPKQHNLNTSYGAIKSTLEDKGITAPTIKDVSDAVIEIRQSKLPDPSKIGNSGSFFKNPIIHHDQFQELKKEYPDIVGYSQDNNLVKVAAGWLIENAGWKGKKIGNTGTHEKQALVLVNHGNATGEEIFMHSVLIIHSVEDKFGIKLEREVNVI